MLPNAISSLRQLSEDCRMNECYDAQMSAQLWITPFGTPHVYIYRASRHAWGKRLSPRISRSSYSPLL